MTQFHEYDVVQVVHLIETQRLVSGTESVVRQPRIGDKGAIVDMPVTRTGRVMYIVESVDGKGNTVWLTDFAPEELELVVSETG